MRIRLAMARRLVRRIGLVDAVRYNIGFWLPVFRRFVGIDRTPAFPYERYSDYVIEADDINAPEMAAALVDRGIDRILLAHSGIIRKPILDIDGPWIINTHPAALPRMRGVDVIRWSILEGVMPAISTHIVDSGVDTGPILDCETIVPLPSEKLCEFERRVNEIAAEKLVDCSLAGPEVFPVPQRQNIEEGRQYYLMPFKLLQRVEEGFALMKRRCEAHGAE
ncbi:MAG: hypothetical protein GY798_07470 [Hyphomicrobiales bacterium]|nr:hypothetical protein [Hyphomicrobiales bacterium]